MKSGKGLVVALGCRRRKGWGVWAGAAAHPVLSERAQSRTNELKLAY